jgi:hypothetical protein
MWRVATRGVKMAQGVRRHIEKLTELDSSPLNRSRCHVSPRRFQSLRLMRQVPLEPRIAGSKILRFGEPIVLNATSLQLIPAKVGFSVIVG